MKRSRQAKLVLNHLDSLYAYIETLTEKQANDLSKEYSLYTATNCGWLEYDARTLILSLIGSRLLTIQNKKAGQAK